MTKKLSSQQQTPHPRYNLPGAAQDDSQQWQAQITAIAARFNREYKGEVPELPAEVEAMPIFQDWVTKALQAKLASPFWQLVQPQKNQRCLDIGCGVSFLIYPWREWEALFYGLEISTVAKEILSSRGPQLNSKLFKGVTLGAAHELAYEPAQCELAIATGVSCYYSLDYWAAVMAEVKRVLKPGGQFVFDLLNPEASLAENWAILETYMGAEVFLEPLQSWQSLIQAAGGKIKRSLDGEIFQLYQVQFL
jgi:SAM-dependent methyltransferase